MKHNIIRNLLIAGTIAGCSGCADLLEEKVYNFLSDQTQVDNKSYDQLVAGAYSTLNWPFEWGNYTQVVNFDCDFQTGPTWAFADCGAGNFYENGSVKNFFQYYSTTIHRCNYHSTLISKMTGVDDAEKNNALGELAFLKAWSYFNLVQFYGGVPLYETSISEGAALAKPRASVKEIYLHIIDRLKFAETAMYSTKDSKYKKGHVSRGAAKALLAKVYATIGSASMPSTDFSLYGGPGSYQDASGVNVKIEVPKLLTFSKKVVAGYEEFDSQEYYKLARDKAKELIDLSDFELAKSQEELWAPANKNGSEFIFTLQTLANDAEMSNYVSSDFLGYVNADPEKGGEYSSGYYVQRDHWYRLFDEQDGRVTWGVMHRIPFSYDKTTKKMSWCYYPKSYKAYVEKELFGFEKTDVLREDAHLYGSKLKKFGQITVGFDGKRSDFNFPFMRYAETILIYAEAANEVEGGPSTDVLDQVEKLNIRNNSLNVKSMNTLSPFTQKSFREYIYRERVKEFAAEGIARFDLLRWGIYLDVMNAIGVDENGVVKRREPRHLLLPLPADEIGSNEFIQLNNPGW